VAIGVSGVRQIFLDGLRACCAIIVLCCTAFSARAQCDADSVVPDLPFLTESSVWARPAGFGHASQAVGADVSALQNNPATLSLLRRIESAGSIVRSSSEVTIGSLGVTRLATTSATRINGLAIAYPFPVYRGSFVVGASFEQPIAFDTRTIRETPFGSSSTITERVTESGGLRIYRVGAAVDVAREVSVGATAFYERGPARRSREVTASTAGSTVTDMLETRTTGSAWGATLGALFRLSPYARLGTTITLPRHLTFRGTGRDEDGSFRLTDQEFRLPAFAAAGVAITPPSVILAADVSLTDWSELEYNADPVFGRVLYRDENAYRAAADIRAGVEWWVPATLLRLRAGFQSTPLRVRFLPDVASESSCAVYVPVDLARDRRAISAGLGYLIAEGFTLDVAWVGESYEREARSPVPHALSETRTDSRVTVSAAFRL
jgi:hypothetical protein